MKAKLILNPVAGTDSATEHLTLINNRLRERVGAVDIVVTVGPGDATQVAARAVRDGYDHLFVAGGDGTLNEALNGVGSIPDGFDRMTFGVIPLGTGNDLATALGFPENIDAALQLLLESRAVRVDIGQLNDRFFVNVSAGGFIAEVSDTVNPQLKTVAGKLAYLIGGAKVVFQYESVRTRLEHAPAGIASDMSLNMFAVCNSRLIGGGRLIAPYAIADDGLLDVCLVETMATADFVALLTRVSTGGHVSDDRVTYFQTAELDLSFDRPIKVNTDGQVLEVDRCSYRVIPRAGRFLAPPSDAGASHDD